MSIALYNAAFHVDPDLLRKRPFITIPNTYQEFYDYKNNFLYLKHAEVLRDRFLKAHPAEYTEGAKVGLAITAVIIVVKVVSDEPRYFEDVLEPFGLDGFFENKNIQKMELLFLKGIDYQVNVIFSEMQPLFPIELWEGQTKMHQLFSLKTDLVNQVLPLFCELYLEHSSEAFIWEDVITRAEVLTEHIEGEVKYIKPSFELCDLLFTANKVFGLSYFKLFRIFGLRNYMCLNQYYGMVIKYRSIRMDSVLAMVSS